MRIAVLADIHGNMPALEAVQREVERLQPDLVVVNGDLINGTPFSVDVVDFIQAQEWLVVRGNHEFYYLDFGTERAVPSSKDAERWGQLHWLVERMTPAHGEFLGTLPDVRTLYIPGTQPVLISHGIPGQNRVGFYMEQDEAEIVSKLEGIELRTVVSAHTHVQIDRQITDRRGSVSGRAAHQWHLVNPGSVGLPLNGNPQAQFAILESVADDVEPGGWSVTHLGVEYDRRPVLEAFSSSGMLNAGGVISELFYWEVCTASPEIIHFYRWCWENGFDPDEDVANAFSAYKTATERQLYVRQCDPLRVGP